MKLLCKISGTILSLIGFVGFFTTSDTVNQIIITGCAVLLFYAGYRLLEKSGALK